MRAVLFIAVTALALGGCASQNFSIRSLPAETPAANNAAAIKNAAALTAAAQAASDTGHASTGNPAVTDSSAATKANTQARTDASAGADSTPSPLTPADVPSMHTYDPWERMNRSTYRFNARFDERVFLPISNGYRRVPGPIRLGVHHFLSNLSEVKNTINYVLQGRMTGGARSLGRFIVNSTFGIGGLFDVAAQLQIENEPTSVGATLSKWGVHPGPFLVIPFLGPSTLRDGVGLLGDFGIEYVVNVVDLYRGNKTWAIGAVNAVDLRSLTSFRYYGSGSPFEYETIRFLYVRKTLIEDDALHAKDRLQKRDASAPAGK